MDPSVLYMVTFSFQCVLFNLLFLKKYFWNYKNLSFLLSTHEWLYLDIATERDVKYSYCLVGFLSWEWRLSRCLLTLVCLYTSANGNRSEIPCLDLETDTGNGECEVCCSERASVTFEPCGHVIVCILCCLKMKKCLKCKVPITAKKTAGRNFLCYGNCWLVSQCNFLSSVYLSRCFEQSVFMWTHYALY